MEDKNDISIATHELSPVTIKNGSQVEEAISNLSGGGGGGEGSGSGSVMTNVEMKLERKRGRPRKFDMDAKTTVSSQQAQPPPPGFSMMTCEKRCRGRPRGSGRLQLLASLGGFAAETAGGSIIPHVITVSSGEDIVSQMISFAQKGSRAMCILSATGVVSSATIRQPGSSGGILRYEGRFEILSLSGSFTFGETTSAHRKTGMLSVSLAKPDGRVFGGGVVGSLIASGPIQLIVASFKQNISKELKLRQLADSSSAIAETSLSNSEMVKFPIQISETTEDEENCINGEAENQPMIINSDSQNVFQHPVPISDQRVSPDINSKTPQTIGSSDNN